MGVYGEIPYPGEFELDQARSKNNSVENSFALGHEMDNNPY